MNNEKNERPTVPQPPIQPPATSLSQPPAVPQFSGYPAAPPAQNPGQTLGIVSIILGFLGISIVGLPLAVVSLVKSSKARVSRALGVIGIILNALVFIGSIIALVVLLAAYRGVNERASLQSSRSVQQSNETTAATIPLSQPYSVSGGDAYWLFPSTYSGWTLDAFDQGGMNRLTRNDKQATFVSFQGKASYSYVTDTELTHAAMASYLSQGSTMKVGEEASMYIPQQSDGKKVEFIVQRYSDTSGGATKQGIIAARAFDNGHILILNYLASQGSFYESEWTALTKKVKINDGVY